MSSTALAASAAPARTADLFAPGRRGLTLGLVSTITLVALESLAIGTVMPIVADELGDRALYGWVYTAFFLGNLLGIVLAGGALDRMPLHRPFVAGLLLFGAGLLIGGLAPTMPILVLGRFVQGLGGGAVGPTAYVAIGRCLPQNLQPKMFAMLSTAWVVPGIIGPSIAAVVGEVTSWRWVFLGLVPLLVLSGSAAYLALRRVAPPAPLAEHEAAASTFRRLPDALLAAGGAAILVAGITSQEPLLVVGGAVLGAAMLVPAFARLTPRGTLLLAIGVPAAILLRGVMTFSFFSADAFLPLLLQTWRGTPATLTGIVFTVTTISWTAGTWYQARHIDRQGPRRYVALGFAFIAIGALLTIPVVLPGVPPEITIVTWMLPGLGMGFMYSAVTLVVLRRSAESEQGSASSALQLSDILGTALGTGIAGAIAAAGERAGGDGLGIALTIILVMSLVSALLGLAGTGRIGAVPQVQSARTAAVD